MFWSLDIAATSSNLNKLLDGENVTLQEIMEEEDVLQELRTDNKKLVNFLIKNENLGELVKMIVSEPDPSIDETQQFKNASLACDMLTADLEHNEMLSDLLLDPNNSSLMLQNTNSTSHFSHFSSMNTPYFSASSPTQSQPIDDYNSPIKSEETATQESGDSGLNDEQNNPENQNSNSPEAGESQLPSEKKESSENGTENSENSENIGNSDNIEVNNENKESEADEDTLNGGNATVDAMVNESETNESEILLETSDSKSPVDSPTLPSDSAPDPLRHINTLFSFLNSKEINPLLASYFSRTLAELLQRKPEKIWSYIRDNQGQEFFQNVVRHINTSAIWDLLMRLMTCKEGRTKTEILTWLNTHGLIKSLIENLKPDKGSLKNHAASLALTDIVRLSRERSEFGFGNPLLDELEQEATINAILDTILEADELAQSKDDSEDCDYTILSGVNVLLSILEPAPSRLSMAPGINNLNMMNDYYNDYSLTDEQEREVQNRYQNVIDVTLNCMAKRIESLTNMLKRPPSRNFRRCPANMPNGIEFKSLGASRLNICKLFTEILKHKNAKMNQIFIKNGVLKTMVDLFFEYCFNNFLHALVTTVIQHIFETPLEIAKNNKDKANGNNNSLAPSLDTTADSENSIENDGLTEDEANLLVENLLVDCQLAHRIVAVMEYEKMRTSENAKMCELPSLLPFHPNLRLPSAETKIDSKSSDDIVTTKLRPPRLPYMGHLAKIAGIVELRLEFLLNQDNNNPPPVFNPSAFGGPRLGHLNQQTKAKNSLDTSKLKAFIEATLQKSFSEEFLVRWQSLCNNELTKQRDRNNKRLGGNLPQSRFGYPFSSNDAGRGSGLSYFYSGNDNEEEEEDQEETQDQRGEHYITSAANDLYDNYANTGLMSQQENAPKGIGSITGDTDTSSASHFDNENLTKGNQIPDYNNVGDYDLSLDDKNSEEIAVEEKQKQDRASYDQIVGQKIPAINENYEDDAELEKLEVKEFKKEYNINHINEDDEDDDSEDVVTDESGTSEEESGEEDESSEEETPDTMPVPVGSESTITTSTVDEFDPWSGKVTLAESSKNNQDGALTTETCTESNNAEFVTEAWNTQSTEPTEKSEQTEDWANFDNFK